MNLNSKILRKSIDKQEDKMQKTTAHSYQKKQASNVIN